MPGSNKKITHTKQCATFLLPPGIKGLKIRDHIIFSMRVFIFTRSPLPPPSFAFVHIPHLPLSVNVIIE